MARHPPPTGEIMKHPHVLLYTTQFCPFCMRARALLDQKGVVYEDRPVDNDPELRRQMTALAGSRTVPQIWIGNRHIGGCDELYDLERRQELDTLLER